MLTTLRDAWKIQDLRNKIVYTLALLFIYRLGSFIPVPFIDTDQLSQIINGANAGMFGFFNTMSGGNFANFTIFAMGITPYINASIIMNLLAFAIPALEALQKEGEEGRKKIAQYTRYLTIVLGLIQALGMSLSFNDLLVERTPFTVFTVVLCVTGGTAFLMYLGEQMTEKGIGNGISMIIFTSIISGIPAGIMSMYQYVQVGTISVVTLIVFVVFIVVVLLGVVAIQEGKRRIPIQYAKRVVGRKMYGGQSSHIPIKVNMAGVIPIIFASSLTLFPATIASFFPPESPFASWVTVNMSFEKWWISLVYVILIVAFTYFYTMLTFNAFDIADNIKKQGGYVQGIRPGKPTVEYLTRILNRLTLFGGLFLAVVAIIPIFAGNIMGLPSLQFGGTSLLILVGVALETMRQIESEMMMRHHDGFLKS